MSGRGNNVYGITPSMEEVAAVTNTIDSSVETEEDAEGNKSIKINLDTASTIISTLSEIATSPQKLSQAKEDLKTVITVEGKTSADVKTALTTELEKVSGDLNKVTVSTSLDEDTKKKVEAVISDVKEALTTITEKIPDEPTQADLATVVIINSLAEQVKEFDNSGDSSTEKTDEEMIKLVDTALAALDALKVTTEVSDIDVLGDFDFTSLLSSSEKEDSKAITQEDALKYVNQLQKSLLKFVSLFSVKGDDGYYKFDEVKYQRFILQMTVIRTSYEVASLGLMPTANLNLITEDIATKLYKGETLDGNIFAGVDFVIKEKRNLTTSDLTMYLLSVAVTEADTFYTEVARKTDDATVKLAEILDAFLEANKENLLKNPIVELNVDAFNDFEEFAMDVSKVKSLSTDAVGIARTVYVIAYESGWSETVFKFAAGHKLETDEIGKFLSDQLGNLFSSILAKNTDEEAN
jgi:hypothetical protein